MSIATRSDTAAATTATMASTFHQRRKKRAVA